LQNKTLRCHLPEKTSAQVSRLLKRLRLHRLVKKVGKSYKYYLTPFGKQVISAGLKLKELFLIPQLALNPAR
jgi:arginine repressor